MLILTRKKDERIMIGDGIVITVVQILADRRVRLGIEAPSDVPVHREEVYDEIQQKKASDVRPAVGSTVKVRSLIGGSVHEGHVTELPDKKELFYLQIEKVDGQPKEPGTYLIPFLHRINELL